MSSNVGSGFRAAILFFKNFKIGLPLYKNMQQSVPELFYFHNVFLKNTVRPILAEPNRTEPGRTEPVGFGSGSVRPKIVRVRFGSAKIEFGRSLSKATIKSVVKLNNSIYTNSIYSHRC